MQKHTILPKACGHSSTKAYKIVRFFMVWREILMLLQAMIFLNKRVLQALWQRLFPVTANIVKKWFFRFTFKEFV